MKISTENSNYTFVWFYTAIYMKISTEHSNFFCLALCSTFIWNLALNIQIILLFFFIQYLYKKISTELSNYPFVWFYTEILCAN